MRGRAFRIHQEKKSKIRARNRMVEAWNWTPPDGKEEPSKRHIGMFSKTPKPCSGPCCGNARKHFGEMKISEKRLRESKILH